MNALDTTLVNDLTSLSNILFTPGGFNNQRHPEESLNMVFFAGYNTSSHLRVHLLPNFNLTPWERGRFETPQIGRAMILGEGLHRRQQVLVKLIYQRPSAIDAESFDGIAAVLIDFERELPAERSPATNPLVTIEGAKWQIVRLRSYKSPSVHDMCRIITYDFSHF
jgi:hypothetical protein